MKKGNAVLLSMGCKVSYGVDLDHVEDPQHI